MRNVTTGATLLTILSLLPVYAAAQRERANPDVITASQLKTYLTFIASDEMEGRNTPSRGLDTAALFISTLLARWGAAPAGDNGTYFQNIDLTQKTIDPAGTHLTFQNHSFPYGDDCSAEVGTAGTVTAPVVYAGDGWLVKSKGIDAYATVDPKGKIVVVSYSGPFVRPKGVTAQDLGSMGTDWNDPGSYAVAKGAVGMIAIVPASEMKNWAQLRDSYSRDRLMPDKFKGAAGIPVVLVTENVAKALFEGEKPGFDEIVGAAVDGKPLASFALGEQKQVTLSVTTTVEHKSAHNIVAVFEGSDPALKSEYVALGAHYDHLGISTRQTTGHAIYNGADDDGSGTTSLIAMAEALSKAPRRPKRSTLFVWHCGEEKGLWGSRYFTQYPTVPLKQIVAQLNIDMIGRSKPADDTKPADRDLSGPDEVYVIGSKMMSSTLGALSERVNKSFLHLSFNYKYDDPKDPNRFFFRSDHFNYAQKGIPIIFYFDGVHEDYHRVTDTVEKIDFRKMERVCKTVYETMWEISGLPTRPAVDRQLPAVLKQ